MYARLYAAANITKKGMWSSTVSRYAEYVLTQFIIIMRLLWDSLKITKIQIGHSKWLSAIIYT